MIYIFTRYTWNKYWKNNWSHGIFLLAYFKSTPIYDNVNKLISGNLLDPQTTWSNYMQTCQGLAHWSWHGWWQNNATRVQGAWVLARQLERAWLTVWLRALARQNVGLTRQGCEDLTMARTKAVHPNCWNKTKCWRTAKIV